MPVRFRTMDGRRVPIGCQCLITPYGQLPREREGHWMTNCPRCRARVFFLRHNGGSVWLDEMGYPWPEHGCFAEGVQRGAAAFGFKGKNIEIIGWLRVLDVITDTGDRCVSVGTRKGIVELCVEKSFWKQEPAPKAGDLVGLDSYFLKLHTVNGSSFNCERVTYYKCAACGQMYLDERDHFRSCKERRARRERGR